MLVTDANVLLVEFLSAEVGPPCAFSNILCEPDDAFGSEDCICSCWLLGVFVSLLHMDIMFCNFSLYLLWSMAGMLLMRLGRFKSKLPCRMSAGVFFIGFESSLWF